MFDTVSRNHTTLYLLINIYNAYIYIQYIHNTYITYTHIYIKWGCSNWSDKISCKNHRLPNSVTSVVRNLLSSDCLWAFKLHSKLYRLFLLSLVTSEKVKDHWRHWALMTQDTVASSNRKVSFFLSSFHSTRICYSSCSGRVVINSPIHGW